MLLDPNLRAPIAISLGAISGALCRYYITLWFSQLFGAAFPYGTFFINLTGCFGMGFFVTLADRVAIVSPEVRLLVATGFLGAYTTFSTYGLDTIKLLKTGSGLWVFYWAGSAALGLLCVELGSFLARKLP